MTLKYTMDSSGTRIKLDALDRNINDYGGLRSHLDGMVGEWLRARASNRFAQGGGTEVGGKWQGLKQSTVDRKVRYGVSSPGEINVRSGALREWITDSDVDMVTTPGQMNIIFPKTNPGFPLNLKLQNAQLGTGSPMNTPARPVVGVNQVDQRAILKMIKEWIIS